MTEIDATFDGNRTAELEASTSSESSLETEEVDAKGGSFGITVDVLEALSMLVFLFF